MTDGLPAATTTPISGGRGSSRAVISPPAQGRWGQARRAVAWLVVAVVAVGCQKQDDIVQYTIPKEDVDELAAMDVVPPGAGEPTRTIGAIVPHGPMTWYFKLRGPEEPVGEQMEEFLALVRSVKIADDPDAKPEWTLPEGWTREPGNELRFATLKTGGEKPLEVSVIPLPGDATDEEYLLANVNRWRKELGLAPVAAKELYSDTPKEETRKLDLHGKQVVLVNLVGKLQAGGMPPFARGPFAGGAGSGTSASSQAGDAAPLTYEVPKGWTPGKSGGMRKAAFTVADGEKKVEITVIDLPAQGQGGDWLANVNRWRGQVKLDPVEAADLAKAESKIDIDGLEGKLVELNGPQGGAGSPQTILGAMAVRDGKAWFLKLQGDSELAAREGERFREFLKSVKFKP